MRFNDQPLKHVAKSVQADKEGRLNYKAPKEGYKERWFKLKGNLLFFFKTNDHGSYIEDSDPLGMILLEKCLIQIEQIADRPFVFSIVFSGEPDRKHFFSGPTMQHCEDWVTTFKLASIEHLRSQLMVLQSQIQKKTGKDPVETLLAPSFDRLVMQRHSLQPDRITVPRDKEKVKSTSNMSQHFFQNPDHLSWMQFD